MNNNFLLLSIKFICDIFRTKKYKSIMNIHDRININKLKNNGL